MQIKLKKILLGNFTTTICIFLILIINIFLLFLPLTNVFGFEFSFLNAILISFLSGLISISFFKKNSTNENTYFSIKYLIRVGIIFLIIPLLISITNSLLGLSCSLKDGFLFYLVLTVPSYIIGLSLGLIAFSISRKLTFLIYLILFILIILIPLAEFYLNPQIYFYNPIFGLFPGTIYDEGLSVNLKLVTYRFLNVIFFLAVFYFLYSNYVKSKILIKNTIVLVTSLFFVLVFLFFSPYLGFTTTKDSLSNYLSRKIVTKHFIIRYPKEINDNKIKTIVLQHEYYYSRLSNYFKVNLNNKIESFVFNSNSQKGKLFGSANADVAKPWLYQIYTTKDSYNTTLEHEIAHIFSASFGKTIFKVADGLNPALIEGVAVAGSPFYDGYPIDYMASLAWQIGFKINLKELFNGVSFFSQTSSISYIYAGSFSKFLIDNYGISKYKLFYKSSEFKKIYHSSIDEITNKYYNYLDAIDTKGDSAKAKYYFGRRTIFTKVCPRYVSDRLKDAAVEFSNKNLKNSLNIYTEILSKTDNYYALIGYAEIEKDFKNIDKGIKEIEEKIGSFKNTAYFYNLQFKLADFYTLNNHTLKAGSLYKKIINERPNIWLEHLSSLRLLLNSSSQLKLYLKGTLTDKLILLQKLIDENNTDIILPVAVRLSKILDIEYDIFTKNFLSDVILVNLKDSYTLNVLSMYMLDNFDFINAKIMIEKAAELSNGQFNNYLIRYNQNKISWMSNNYKNILSQMYHTKKQ